MQLTAMWQEDVPAIKAKRDVKEVLAICLATLKLAPIIPEYKYKNTKTKYSVIQLVILHVIHNQMIQS